MLSLLDVSNDDLDEQDGHYTEKVPFEANAEYRGVPLFVLWASVVAGPISTETYLLNVIAFGGDGGTVDIGLLQRR